MKEKMDYSQQKSHQDKILLFTTYINKIDITWETISAKWKFFICLERKALTFTSSVSPAKERQKMRLGSLAMHLKTHSNARLGLFEVDKQNTRQRKIHQVSTWNISLPPGDVQWQIKLRTSPIRWSTYLTF